MHAGFHSLWAQPHFFRVLSLFFFPVLPPSPDLALWCLSLLSERSGSQQSLHCLRGGVKPMEQGLVPLFYVMGVKHCARCGNVVTSGVNALSVLLG